MSRTSVLVALSVLIGAAVATAALLPLLPASGAVPEWTIVPGTDKQSQTTDDFYRMYDGAAPEMIRQGIVAAAQRTYQRETDRLTVDVFKFATGAQARAYFQLRKGEIVQCKGFWAGGTSTQGTARAISGRSYIAYLWQRQFYCALTINGTSPSDKGALETFSTRIHRAITAQR